MRMKTTWWLSMVVAGALAADSAQAHFLWLVTAPQEQPTEVKMYFGEAAIPDDPDLLDNVAKSQAFAVMMGRDAETKPLELKKVDDALVASLPKGSTSAAIVNLSYGVITRGESSFLLKYYAKAYPSSLPGTWQAVNDKERLPFEIVPHIEGSTATVEVLWQGKPVADATVTVDGPGLSKSVEGTTDAKGLYRLPVAEPGVYSIRARRIEQASGEQDGKVYKEIRHYTTIAMPYSPPQVASVDHQWQKLAKPVTSFGGAVLGDWLYIYGGHYGAAHHYNKEGQSGDFRRLNLKTASAWEELPGGPKLTGLAMVAHGDKLYRVGGFTAKNSESEDESLWSQSDFARFDPKSGQWTQLPSLPEGRSSHDAAVVGDTLYVVGGWNMQAGSDTVWHDTAWKIDLTADNLEWKPIAQPLLRRRAVALAAWQGKLYVLGGMKEVGGTTTRVDVYDPAADKWSSAPALLGAAMDGFGCSAFAADGRLYATTMSGSVQRLSNDGSTWELVGALEHPRFFHRLLPWQSKELVAVGGAHMAVGKIDELERLKVKAVGGAE